MNVEELIDELYEMVEKAWNLPLSRGRAVLDGEEVKQILDEIRENLPQELLKAKAIVADRNQIISTAKTMDDSRRCWLSRAISVTSEKRATMPIFSPPSSLRRKEVVSRRRRSSFPGVR